MHNQIYVTINGEQFGPYTESELRLHVAEKKVLQSDYAYHDGLPGWITVAELLASTAPPVLQIFLANASGEDRTFFEQERTAAEKGDVEAQLYLGDTYQLGEIVPKNCEEAVRWYRKAAEQGHVPAQSHLGHAYYLGSGVEKDHTEAAKWFYKAASAGYANAQTILGIMLSHDDGVEAANWYLRAAAQGEPKAQYCLGLSYKVGFGVPQDFVEAYKWFNLAAAQGHEEAFEERAIIAEEMTREQVAFGQQLAAVFVPRIEFGANYGEVVSSEDSFKGARSGGTGFFITDDGYLISNFHVVKDVTKVRLVTNAGMIDAKVVSVDAANDLALLKAEGEFSSLPISPSRSAQLGGTVATVGFPNIGLQGFAPKLAKGEIASLSGASDDPRYFQISVPVQPGNSGGALVDERGNVIGIVSAKLDAVTALAASGALPENVNYAVKSSLLLSFLESVPAVSAKLKAPVTADRKFEDVVKSAQDAAVLVLVY